MKKLITISLTILFLGTLSFAQSTQQKIDSLKKEQVKAEQAKKEANDKLRQNPNDENYNSSVAAGENLDRINREIADLLNAQKAEAEAKAKAAAEAKAKAAAEAKAAERKKLEDLYKKKFPEFVEAQVNGKISDSILEQLKKDPNYDIVGIEDFDDRQEFVIKSASGPKSDMYISYHEDDYDNFYNKQAFERLYYNTELAVFWHNNPDRFYMYKKGQEKMETFKKSFANYYLGYTGKNLNVDIGVCKEVKLYDASNYTGENFIVTCDGAVKSGKTFTNLKPENVKEVIIKEAIKPVKTFKFEDFCQDRKMYDIYFKERQRFLKAQERHYNSRGC